MCDREFDEREYDEREAYDISRTDDYNREFGGYKPRAALIVMNLEERLLSIQE